MGLYVKRKLSMSNSRLDAAKPDTEKPAQKSAPINIKKLSPDCRSSSAPGRYSGFDSENQLHIGGMSHSSLGLFGPDIREPKGHYVGSPQPNYPKTGEVEVTPTTTPTSTPRGSRS
jgi:hypothetical protein